MHRASSINSGHGYNHGHSSSSGGGGLGPLQARLQDKLEERNAVAHVNENSRNLANQFDQLADATDDLVKGAQTVESVLENWQSVFRSINVASASLLTMKLPNSSTKASESTEEPALPERVVRIPARESNEDNENSNSQSPS